MTFDPIDFIRSQTEIKAPTIVPEIKLHLVTEVMPLWEYTEATLNEGHLPPPFWAIAWPGGQGIARYILDHPQIVRGRRVVDFAAGSGLAAIAAMKAGAAQAVAVDIDPLALTAIGLNAKNNDVVVDIMENIDLDRPFTKADVILAGDVCYQQMMATSVMRWLRLCAEEGVEIYMADPGRAYVPENGLSLVETYRVPTSKDIEDSDMRVVKVWRLEKGVD